jgi:TonB family protein
VTIAQPIELDIPELPVSAQPEMSIDSPRIDPSFTVDIAPYSARAELTPGIVATILLMLEISPDGSVLSAEIVRSSAGEAANAAAIKYAQTTHWMPGKIDGEPRAMQASLTVILGERG